MNMSNGKPITIGGYNTHMAGGKLVIPGMNGIPPNHKGGSTNTHPMMGGGRRRRHRGGNVGDFIVDKLKKPSTYLGAASFIPGIGVVPGIAAGVLGALGLGRRKRGGGRRRRHRGGNDSI